MARLGKAAFVRAGPAVRIRFPISGHLSDRVGRKNNNRGFIASWPQFDGPAGLFLANLAVLVFSWISGDQFLVWGWRIPFFISIIMVGIGLWIRLGISETPVFQKVIDEERVERVPVLGGHSLGRSAGKRITSRIASPPVRTMASRSIPSPSPPVGGIP